MKTRALVVAAAVILALVTTLSSSVTRDCDCAVCATANPTRYCADTTFTGQLTTCGEFLAVFCD